MSALAIFTNALCALGLYASVFMYRKALADSRGELSEPSVVQQPAARLFFSVPNAFFGILYYVALGCAIWLAPHALGWLVLIPVVLAAAVSAYLAYSLLFITRMPCPFCWTSHAINWMLLLAVATFYKLT